MKILDLFNQYKETINQRRENRKIINDLIEKNRQIKIKHNAIRKKLISEVVKEMKKGATLYQICRNNFGRVDSRFHNLYFMVVKKTKKEVRKK